ncbi:hypothetical protein EVAR_92065_1 [Eumeta japonica]|uniref:Uncharacterized protein n=1 Tax=Eumeta variegata TaxID=151549 RepID=A0A4C1T0Y9_EUMVA|nr:hypothetical protein EVAR_92065_1 [Eumeta japonica]
MLKNHTLSVNKFRPFFLNHLLEPHQLLAVEMRIDGFARRPLNHGGHKYRPRINNKHERARLARAPNYFDRVDRNAYRTSTLFRAMLLLTRLKTDLLVRQDYHTRTECRREVTASTVAFV